MIKFLAATAFILAASILHSRAAEPEGCTPLLTHELKVREFMDKGTFQVQLTIFKKEKAQEVADRLSVGLHLDKLPGVERVRLLFNKEHQMVAVYPLQRLSPNDDLISCHFVVIPMQLFVQALHAGKGEDI